MPGGWLQAPQSQLPQGDMNLQNDSGPSDRATAVNTSRSSAASSAGQGARRTNRRTYTWLGCGGSPAIAPGTTDPGEPTEQQSQGRHGYTQSAPGALQGGAGTGSATQHKANHSAPAVVPVLGQHGSRSAPRGGRSSPTGAGAAGSTRSVETRHAFHKLTTQLKREVEKGLSYGLNPDFRVPLVVRTLELCLSGSEPLPADAITTVPGLTTLLRYAHEQLSIAAGLDPIPLLQGRASSHAGTGEILAMGPDSGSTSPVHEGAGSSAVSSSKGSPLARARGGEGAKERLKTHSGQLATGLPAAAANSRAGGGDVRVGTGPGAGPLLSLPTRSPVAGGPGSRGGMHSAHAGDDKKEGKWVAHLSHLSSCSDGFDGFGEYAADLEREEREEGEGGRRGKGSDVSRADLDRGIRVEVIMRQPGAASGGPSPRDPINPAPGTALSVTSAHTTLVLPGSASSDGGMHSTPPRTARGQEGPEGVTGIEDSDSGPASAASNRGRRRVASDTSAFPGGLPPSSGPRSTGGGARSSGPPSARSHVPRLSFDGPGVGSTGPGSAGSLPGGLGSTGGPPHGQGKAGPGSSLSMEYSFQDEFVQELARQALEREGIVPHKAAGADCTSSEGAGDFVQALLRPAAFASPEAQAILAELQVMPTFAHESQLSPSDSAGKGSKSSSSESAAGIRVAHRGSAGGGAHS